MRVKLTHPGLLVCALAGLMAGGVAAASAGYIPGDANCSGAIDCTDVDAFMLAVSDPASYASTYPGCNMLATCDMNSDGQVDTADLFGFLVVWIDALGGDVDGDIVAGECDNCPEDANPNQENTDGDILGDACDPCPTIMLGDANLDGQVDCDDLEPFIELILGSKLGGDDACIADFNGDGHVDNFDIPGFIEVLGGDADEDGMPEDCDNCPGLYNPEQEDGDGDLVGDECDNCPDDYNPGQENTDGDILGDACDPCPTVMLGDANEDGQVDCDDVDPFVALLMGGKLGTDPLCIADFNGDGSVNNMDLPGFMDVLGGDADEDGIPGDCDNCPDDYNPGQENTDGDILGDACDPCPTIMLGDVNLDGQVDCDDVAPFIDLITGGKLGVDSICVADFNGDGLVNNWDIAGFFALLGDDADEDGIPEACDNCPGLYNPYQLDTDGDWFGDACDPCPTVPAGDANCDGVVNNFDISPFVLALTHPDEWESLYTCGFVCANDTNGDGRVDNFDIADFVDRLTPPYP